MAAPAVVEVSNSRLSGTDAKPLQNVTFSEDLSDPGVHQTSTKMTPIRRGGWGGRVNSVSGNRESVTGSRESGCTCGFRWLVGLMGDTIVHLFDFVLPSSFLPSSFLHLGERGFA